MIPMLNRRDWLACTSLGLMGAGTAGLATTALAESSFPAKPIRFIVPLAPGGAADLLARQVGQHLEQLWGQPVVVDMRPGAGTIIGTGLAASAPADGYTLLFVANSLVINAKLHSHLPYDGLHAFDPVAEMVVSPQVLAVQAASPLRSFQAWVQAARASAGAVSLASLGPATTQHIASEMLQHACGVKLTYVPYAGGALAVNAVLGGHVDTVLGNLSEMMSQIDAGHLRALAVTTPQRLQQLPSLPTVAEAGGAGCAGFEAVAWFGVAAPAGTPAAVVARLAEGVRSAMADPGIRHKLVEHGLQPAYLGPTDFGAHIRSSFERYSRLIDDSGMTVS